MITSHLGSVLETISTERIRQERLKSEGKFMYTLADPQMADVDRLAALMEEVGEVATALLEENKANHPRGTFDVKGKELYKELIQVAAVATAWAEFLHWNADIAKATQGQQ